MKYVHPLIQQALLYTASEVALDAKRPCRTNCVALEANHISSISHTSIPSERSCTGCIALCCWPISSQPSPAMSNLEAFDMLYGETSSTPTSLKKSKKKAMVGSKPKKRNPRKLDGDAVESRGPPLTTLTTPSLDKKGLMQVALRQSMTGGSFIDTKFFAFSRRRSAGVVDEPLPVYASSALLRTASKYFDGCACACRC